MKARDSGMPDEAMWGRFFDARQIVTELDFTAADADVADFGCGYGTFTVAAARLTSGNVYALDIDTAMIAATAAKAASFGLDNVTTMERDFIAEGTVRPRSCRPPLSPSEQRHRNSRAAVQTRPCAHRSRQRENE